MRYDVILITGDAYWDHPTNGAALIKRLLMDKGYSVAVFDKPDFKDSFSRFGKPRLFYAVSSGCMDSMLANYTPLKKPREGKRLPDRAVITYCNKIRENDKETPIVIAGVEASLRRLAHYDYWDNKVRRSILLDSRADIIAYGMAERQILEIAIRLKAKKGILGIRGTVTRQKKLHPDTIILPSFDEVAKDRTRFADSFVMQYNNRDAFSARTLAEPYDGFFVVQEPPALPLTTEEMDYLYGLPFTRELPHEFKNDQMMQAIRFSVTTHRGCFGGCSFCSIGFLQGKRIQSRSIKSIIDEIKSFTRMKAWRGIVYDLGGPTANMYGMNCMLHDGNVEYISIEDGRRKMMPAGIVCKRDCLPGPCKNLDRSNAPLLSLLREVRAIKGVKKAFVRSGTRYDLMDDEYINELAAHHVSGQLKVAPEHVNPDVLKLMNKQPIVEFERFRKRFTKASKTAGKQQFLLPYLVVAHPGCGMKEARELANYIRRNRIAIEQVQVFTPTPMTLSTCMYWTGMDPFTRKKVYVPYSYGEKKEQKRLLFGGKSSRPWQG